MILSIGIVTGFQREIRSKVVGFGSHIKITDFNFEDPSKSKPIDQGLPFYERIKSMPEVRSIQAYAEKEGIIKTDDEVKGVVAKGVDTDYDWEFFESNLIMGNRLKLSKQSRSDDALISRVIADKMQLSVGDKFYVFFIQNNRSRPRKFGVAGIYETGMSQFDNNVILCDIKHIRKIHGWQENKIGGYEVVLADYGSLMIMDQLFASVIPPKYNATTITSSHPEIFGWLELQDMNVIIIISLMILVSGINMISALLILILERTNMIGLLKAFGAQNGSIRNIFLVNAAYLILVGLFWGNLLGIALSKIQQTYGLIKLPQEQYYLSQVPVDLDFWSIVLVNFGTMTLCLLMLLLPSLLVAKISPVKAIKFN